MTKNDILELQQKWANAVMAIGKDKEQATSLLNELYDFESEGELLFKPTLASHTPVRIDFEGTLSYFIGGNSKFSEDKGFALKGWEKIDFDNHGYVLGSDLSLVMGVYKFTDGSGNVVQADYTFGYRKDSEGKAKIKVHHSSFSNLD